jgi:hypothetical protein
VATRLDMALRSFSVAAPRGRAPLRRNAGAVYVSGGCGRRCFARNQQVGAEAERAEHELHSGDGLQIAPRTRSIPSPASGGGIGRGHAQRFARFTPSPPLPRKRGREQTEVVARADPATPSSGAFGRRLSCACSRSPVASLLSLLARGEEQTESYGSTTPLTEGAIDLGLL